MAEGGEDFEMADSNDYPLPENYDTEIGETSFTNPLFDEGTHYNTIDNSNLSYFDQFKEPPLFTETATPQKGKVDMEGRMKILKNPNFVEGTKWKFTNTNLEALADLVYTPEEVKTKQVDNCHPKIDGPSVNYLFNEKNKTSLYMIGKNRSGDNRITDNNGKLLKRSTIEGVSGRKVIADQLSDLSHYHESTGLYADLRRQKENEAAAKEEKRREATVFFHNLGSKETGEQTQSQIRKPTPQRSNVASRIEDIIHSDNESITSDILNETLMITLLLDITSELEGEFGEYDAREIRGLKLSEKKIAEARKQLIDKIALLDEQVGQETDPVKKKKIQETLDTEKRNLRYLNDEYDSQKQRWKKIWRDYLKKPDSLISLKDRLKLLFKIEGFTIAAVIAAITMFFSTLGLAISNSLRGSGGGSAPSPPSPDKPPSIPDRVKEGLKKFAEWLKNLAGKSAAALPGIIGSIVSFILKSVGAAVGFLAEHLIILLFIIISSMVYGLIQGVKIINKKSS